MNSKQLLWALDSVIWSGWQWSEEVEFRLPGNHEVGAASARLEYVVLPRADKVCWVSNTTPRNSPLAHDTGLTGALGPPLLLSPLQRPPPRTKISAS